MAPLIWRGAARVTQRCCCRSRSSHIPTINHLHTRSAHSSTQPSPACSPTLTHPSTSTSKSIQSSSPSSSPSSASLFPNGAPIIVSKPSRFYLSPTEQAVRDASVAEHLHQQRRVQSAYDDADNSHIRIVFDLAYSHPTRQAATSLVTQLQHVAHTNRTAPYPARLHVQSLDPRILTDEPIPHHRPAAAAAAAAEQMEDESAAAADHFVRQMRRRWSDSWLIHRSTTPLHQSSHNPATLLYLSPDAPHILWRLHPRLTYVVGGLVDKHNVVSDVTLRAAGVMQVRCGRLPIRECIPGGLRKSALNIDTVFAILMHVHQAAQRIRHGQQVEHVAPAVSEFVGQPALYRLDNEYGLQWFPVEKKMRFFKRPLFGMSLLDEGIDWYRLWCDAFDAIIPARLRWSAEDERTLLRR